MSYKRAQLALLVGMLGCPWSLAQGADQEAAQLAREVCAACHGASGVSQNPLVPTLAGQPYTLIEDNLLAFRQGKRACSEERDDGSPAALLAQTMCQAVADLSDSEIASLASLYESEQFMPASQQFDPELAQRGEKVHHRNGCEHCHSRGGSVSNGMAPLLAGQWMPYLRRSMSALQSGTKKGPKVMNEAIHELDAAEIEALLHFYASRNQ